MYIFELFWYYNIKNILKNIYIHIYIYMYIYYFNIFLIKKIKKIIITYNLL